MKAKKLLVFLLALVVVLTLTIAACQPDEPETPTKTDAAVEVTSNKTPTIEIGQTYTLTYTSSDTVKVTVNPTDGCTYSETTNKFTATKAGTYTLTVTASGENKNDKVVTVTITVTASNVDRTALAAAIASVDGLVESDYTTASWRTLTVALEAAEEVNETAGKTQAEVDKAKADLDNAVSELEAKALTKAEVTAEQITFGGNVYTTKEYSNIVAIGEEIADLNANEEITLQSQYAAEIAKLLAKLETRILVNIAELTDDAAMVVSALKDWNLHITATEGATLTVKVGLAADTAKEHFATLTAEEDGTYAIAKEDLDWDTEYVICVTASGVENKEDVSIERHVKFIRANYIANVNGASVENDVLKVTQSYSWDDHLGKKIVPEGLQLIGEFTVTFDLKFTEGFGGAQVMALFLHREDNGQVLNHWIAIRYQDNKMELANDNNKPVIDMPAGTVNIGNTMRFRLTRTFVNGQSKLKGELIDIATGKVLATHNDGGTFGYSEIVSLGFQSENVAWEVTNVTIGMDDVARNVAGLRTAIAGYEVLKSGNYTSATWTTAKDAYEAAVAALNDKTKSQADVDELAATLNTAVNALEAKSVEGLYTLETEDETVISITYNEKTYTSAIYTNIVEIAEELEAISEELSYLEYTAKIEEALAKLESALAITINTGLRENILTDAVVEQKITVNTTLNKEAVTEGVTYEWTVNGEVVADQTGATYTWTPAFGTKYTISVIARYTDEDNQTVESNDLEVVCSFVEAHPYIPQDFVSNRNAKFENGVYSIGTGTPWGNWEGRKLVFDELVFNGSFEITLDFKVVQFENPGVITMHFLNADTLSLRSQADNAVSGYACVNINANELETAPKKMTERHDWINNLKTNGSVATMTATFKKQMNNDIKITVTLTYVANDGTVYSDSFTSDQTISGLEHGMYVGLNIENASFEVSNISYKLLNEAGLMAGSITNKSALRVAIANAEEKLAESDKYFLDGVQNLQSVLQLAKKADNGVYAENYDVVIAAINAAIANLKEKDFDVIITGMDYTHYATAPEAITASLPEDVEGTIKWSYKLNDAEEATIVDSATLENLADGVYNELTVIVTINGEEVKFLQPTLTVGYEVTLKSNQGYVTISEDGKSATAQGNGSWDTKDPLVIDGVYSNNFELTYDIQASGTYNGGNHVTCLNLWSEWFVIGLWRADPNSISIGFDNDKSTYKSVTGADAELLATGKITVNAKVVTVDGQATITITVSCGTYSETWTRTRGTADDDTTMIRLSFENMDHACTVSNFQLSYK